MSAADMLVFADFDGVTGPPTIDGFATTDAGVITTEAEPGYVNGGRITIGGSGLPPVIIQAVKDGNTLVLGISCRGDPSFDDLDGVVIGLRQNGGSSAGPQRRIDVFPVWGNTTNPPDVTQTGFGAANPDPNNANAPKVAEPADNATFDIRTNKPLRKGPVYYQRASNSGNWTSYTPAKAADTTRYNIRARSWRPSVAMGSPVECAWSVEVRIPIDTSAGNGDWINLADDFGLFIDVIRGFRMLDMGDPVYKSTQFVFPLTAPILSDILDETTDIPASSFGHGLKNGAVSQGQGVRLKNGALGIGRRPTSNPAAPLTGTISGVENNTMVALLENTGPAATGVKAEVRLANWGLGPPDFAAWNPPPGCQNPSAPVNLLVGTTMVPATGETTNSWPAAQVPADYAAATHQCMWVQLDATGGGVTFSQSSARRNMDFVGLSEVTRDAEVSGVGYPAPANGGPDHDFLLFTRCRKIVVKELVKLSDHLDPETLTLVGGALEFDGAHDVAKNAAGMEMKSTQVPTWENTVVYLWITEGFRRTGKTLVINGIKSEILDNGPSDFGLTARHDGIDDNLNWSFSGGGLVKYGPGICGLKVPHKGKVKIGIRLSAGPQQPGGDVSDLPPAPGGKPIGPGGKPPKGCLALLFGLFGKTAPVLLLGALATSLVLRHLA